MIRGVWEQEAEGRPDPGDSGREASLWRRIPARLEAAKSLFLRDGDMRCSVEVRPLFQGGE